MGCSRDDAQIRVVSPHGQRSRLLLILEADLVGSSVHNPVASGMVRGGKFIQRKQIITALHTQPSPFPSNTSRPRVGEPKTRVDADHV